LLADVALLIHLDGVDAGVAAGVRLVGDGVIEGLANLAEAVIENVVEAEKHRSVNATLAQTFDDFVEVNLLRRVFGGHDSDVPVGVGADVTLAPIRDAIQRGGIGSGPLSVNERGARA
jgi:hypothetical protein